MAVEAYGKLAEAEERLSYVQDAASVEMEVWYLVMEVTATSIC